MATQLSLSGQIAEGNTLTYVVEESFDTVINKVCPVSPLGSSLEYQQAAIFTNADTGKRLLIHPNLICVAEELADGSSE